MEIDTMGRVVVPARIENIHDLYFLNQGTIQDEAVHRVSVEEALIDTGATHLAMPLRLIHQLGFEKPLKTYQVQTTNGTASRGIYGPVRLTVQDRFCTIDIAEVPDDCPVLIGQVPLELLDFVVDPKNHCLIGNPRHGGQQMFEQF